MTTDFAIRVEDLSKCYRIYERPQDRVRQAIYSRLSRLTGQNSKRFARRYYREFWALRDVSFDVRRGEAVGIIGRNGAGKSTLLQLIAGTLFPTAGKVNIQGRVAALLELGAGFNPEFTGRENVQLNGSLFGLSAAQLHRRFDEIAAFADIGDFIDQPVKTYSSGMMVRLAFAVQTAMSPEVLIIDEALAVGDVFFQAKCMARLRKLIADGVSLLFVSHDTATVRQICNRALLLDRGRPIAYGSAAEVADQYLHIELEDRNAVAHHRGSDAAIRPISTMPIATVHTSSSTMNTSTGTEGEARSALIGADRFTQKARYNRVGTRTASFVNVQMLKEGKLCDVFDFGDVITLRQAVRFNAPLENVNVVYKIRTPQGVDIVFGDTRLVRASSRRYEARAIYVFDWVFQLNLMHGAYCVMSGLTHPPTEAGDDWEFIDMIPISYDFRMLGRREGMIDGFVTWNNTLSVTRFDSAVLAAIAPATFTADPGAF